MGHFDKCTCGIVLCKLELRGFHTDDQSRPVIQAIGSSSKRCPRELALIPRSITERASVYGESNTLSQIITV